MRHYTCACQRHEILKSGFIRPTWQPALNVTISWWTDLYPPMREALGLTSHLIDCDRTAYCFESLPGNEDLLHPWLHWSRDRIGRRNYALLETPDTLPRHWWVSQALVPVLEVPA